MAAVVVGGLVTSTALNLFVVPALYLRFGARDEGSREPVRPGHRPRPAEDEQAPRLSALPSTIDA